MKTLLLFIFCLLFFSFQSFSWGFYAHGRINYYAVFLLPPEMMILYKPSVAFLQAHATDPDKRRYAVPEEGPRHYIDIDHYGQCPFYQLPRKWKEAVDCYSEDSLKAHGIVPWHIQVMLNRLTASFAEKDYAGILRNSAEIGHYISDAHVPLHTSSNHDGQLTNQRGIHGFWESRVPELLAAKQFDFFIGKASYISDPSSFIWDRILESAAASDSVLSIEKELSAIVGESRKYGFEERNGKTIKQYSSVFTTMYNKRLNGMVERRMRQSIYAVASLWFTAWVNAGQPDLKEMVGRHFSEEDDKVFEELNRKWLSGGKMLGRGE